MKATKIENAKGQCFLIGRIDFKMMKKLSGVIVAITSILAVFLLLKENFNWAVFCITLMFTITNAMRAKDMSSKGFEKESKWMKNVSIFFGIASAAILVVNLFM